MIIHYTYNTVIYSKWLSICLSHLYRLFSHHGDLRCHQPELPVSIGQDNLPPFDTRTALEVIEEDLAAVKDWCFMGHGSESCPPKNTCFLVGKMMIEHAMFGSSQFSDNPNWWKFKLVNFFFLSLGYYWPSKCFFRLRIQMANGPSHLTFSMEDPEELTICSAIQLSAKRYATESSACMCISRASIMEAVCRGTNIQNRGSEIPTHTTLSCWNFQQRPREMWCLSMSFACNPRGLQNLRPWQDQEAASELLEQIAGSWGAQFGVLEPLYAGASESLQLF